MNILFVTLNPIYNSSSATMRNKALIQGFLNNDHKVTILTRDDSDNICHPLFSKNNYKVIFTKKNELYEKIKSNKSNLLKKFLKSMYHKVAVFDNTIKIAKNTNLNLLDGIEMYYDVIISSSDPKSSHKLVISLIKQGLNYGKWIQYWGDPLSFDITRKNILPIFINKLVEVNIIKNADRIVYVSPFTLVMQKKHFQNQSNKMESMPIPYKEKRILKNGNEKIIGYFGDYNSNVRNIIPLLEYVKVSSDYKFIIAGKGDITIKPGNNLESMNRISYDQIRILEESVSIFIVILNKKGTQIPGKIYDLAATNKPILVILDGEHKIEIFNYLNEFKRYYFCENNLESIEEAIRKIEKNGFICKNCDQLDCTKVSQDFLNFIK